MDKHECGPWGRSGGRAGRQSNRKVAGLNPRPTLAACQSVHEQDTEPPSWWAVTVWMDDVKRFEQSADRKSIWDTVTQLSTPPLPNRVRGDNGPIQGSLACTNWDHSDGDLHDRAAAIGTTIPVRTIQRYPKRCRFKADVQLLHRAGLILHKTPTTTT